VGRAGRLYDRWHLDSGVKRNREHPESFEIPEEDAKQAIEPGVFVKLLFDTTDLWGRRNWGERMWVEIVAVKKRHIVGVLDNDPIGIPRLYRGDQVKFRRHHIVDILWEPDIGSEPDGLCQCEPAEGDADPPPIQGLCAECNGPLEPPPVNPELPPPRNE
jgi:Uncharacterized protein conserved in bacteria (DUF2314)